MLAFICQKKKKSSWYVDIYLMGNIFVDKWLSCSELLETCHAEKKTGLQKRGLPYSLSEKLLILVVWNPACCHGNKTVELVY